MGAYVRHTPPIFQIGRHVTLLQCSCARGVSPAYASQLFHRAVIAASASSFVAAPPLWVRSDPTEYSRCRTHLQGAVGGRMMLGSRWRFGSLAMTPIARFPASTR